MKHTFQRKLAVEFLDNLDLVKLKTSRAKKTLRSLISFMNERVNIETRYAQSLHNLAKTGGVSISYSLIEFKNYEEQTMRDAINALINFTIQESELHKEFAAQTKTNIVQVLDETRKNLSLNKKNWMNKLEQLKKQILEANQIYKREYLRYQQQTAIVEDSLKKRNEQYLKHGLKLDEQLKDMPKAIYLAEQKYQEAVTKFNEIKKITQLQQDNTEKCVADFNKGSQDILEQIEKQEYQRLDVLKSGLNNFSASIVNLNQQHESLHKLIEQEFRNLDPMKDIQLFIAKNSTFAENERLRNLYKELGLYQPLNEESSSQSSDRNKLALGSGLVVEKSSRTMALQLKQMEEDRKRKAQEDEQAKQAEEKLKKCQSIVNQLKDTREILYKLGNQAMNYGSIELLYAPRPGSTTEFKIGNKSAMDQWVFVLLNVFQYISTNSLPEKFGITDEMKVYLDPLIANLCQQKPNDMFQILNKALEYYKQTEITSGNKFFENQISAEEKAFYKSLLGLAWTWVRLIILRHSVYNLEQYEKELNSFIDQVELEHHQQSQYTLEAIEFTFNALKYVQKVSKKESFTLSYPLNYLLHQNLMKVYFDDKQKSPNSVFSSNYQDLFLNLQQFSDKILGLKPAYQIKHMMKYVFMNYLKGQDNFSDFSESQNKALYTLKTLIQKLNKEHHGQLGQKTISVELVKDAKIEEPLDYFSTANKEPAKLLMILNNTWVMSDLCKEVFTILENYETNFGECFNKLRLMLDFGSICFRTSFVFISDGSFQQRLKSEVLIKAGERAAQRIMEKEGYELPFVVSRKSQSSLSKGNIIDVINKFTESLRNEEQTYKKVWDSHLLKFDPSQKVKQHNLENSIFHYSQKMASLIEEDLGQKLEDLDFDKDPHQIVGSVIVALQQFDKVSRRKTLNVMKPKLEAWIQLKLVNIRELVSRSISFENWLPVSDKILHSESVVNVFYTLNENLENLYDFVGHEIFLRWSKCIQVMVHDCLFEYCEALMSGLDNTSQYKPSDVLPPLNLAHRKGKKQGQFAISKKPIQIEYTPEMFNQLAGMGSKNWVDFAASSDQNTSLQKLLTRLANLDFINEQLTHMKVRFFALSHPDVEPFDESQLFKSAYEVLSDTARSIIQYIANKMTYIDFNDVIFYNLYIGKGSDMIILRQQLPHLNNYMRTVYQKTPRRYFKETLTALHQTLIDALLRYLMLLSSLGALLGVTCDDFFKNPIILTTDIREIINFFCPRDREGNEVGLKRVECEANSEVIFRFIQYMKEDDQMLIGLFKSVDTDVQRNKEMISRILYRRNTKDVDKFFDDYKTLFGK